MSGKARRLLRIGLTVADLPRAIEFYRDALGFTPAADGADADMAPLLGADQRRTARLRLGGEELELAEFDPPGAPYPPDSRAADLWFQHFAIVTTDMRAAYERLRRHAFVPISDGGSQSLPPSSGSVTAYKFRDPDGHPLELIQFPPGIGDPRWQIASSAATLGIDHSAISVADSARSIAFYGALGLAVQARQVNSGPEQDRLDGLGAVAVEVIGLAPPAAATPHVELLCYRAPRGRPAPPRQPRDIADTRLIFAAAGLAASAVPLPSGARATIQRDPDGHAIILREQP